MIRVEGLSKTFGRTAALDRVTLAVPRGEILALLGPNGSGKSTCIKSIAGLVLPSAGRIAIDGLDLAADRDAALARASYLPQRASFPESLTGLEVLRFYARLRRLPAGAVGAAAAVAGLDGTLGRRVGTYSGGMAQRLGLGVLALPDSPVLLLDEPFSGLDPAATASLAAWLRAERERGKAILLATHRLEDAAELGDRVGILVRGRLAAILDSGEVRSRARVEVRLTVEGRADRLAAAARRAGGDARGGEGGRVDVAAPGDRIAEVLAAVRDEGGMIVRIAGGVSIEGLYREVTDDPRSP